MKKIKKTYQGVVPNGKVLNTKSASQIDTYSCEYINNLTKDDGWKIVDATLKYKRIGNVVTVTGYSGGTTALIANDYKTVSTLPEEARPSTLLHFHWTRIGAGGAIAKVNTNGTIQLFADTETSYWAFTFTYVI